MRQNYQNLRVKRGKEAYFRREYFFGTMQYQDTLAKLAICYCTIHFGYQFLG